MQSNIENPLDIFRENFPLVRLMQYDDMLVYPSGGGLLKRAESIISDKSLPLKATVPGDVAHSIFRKNLLITPTQLL